MTVLVTPDEMLAAEAAAIAAGRSAASLMLAAATGIAEWLDTHIPQRRNGRRFCVALIGPGNNGGDGLVALGLLIERGWRCGAVLVGREQLGELPGSSDALRQVEICQSAALDEADVVLDGVYGVRGRSSLRHDVVDVFRQANEARRLRCTPQIAIDVPSGVDSGTGEAAPGAFLADVTLCLGLPKLGLIHEPAATHVGELELIDIGIVGPSGDRRPTMIDERSVRQKLPRRTASAHKHQTGTALVIGGAPTYYGAPRMAAEAAARAGAGLVCAAVPASIAPVIAGQVPEIVLLPLDESGDNAAAALDAWIAERARGLRAAVIGPGLGHSRNVDALLETLLGRATSRTDGGVRLLGTSIPLVLDADALNWIARRGEFPKRVDPMQAVITPHAAELARLLHCSVAEVLSNTISAAATASERFKQVVILKHGYGVVASPDGRIRFGPRAVPELATAGTGDVLAGLVGGLLAQGLATIDAAEVGLFVGAIAGRNARRSVGTLGVVARDVIERIPGTLGVLGDIGLSVEGL